jgi:hypothetical protein
VVPARGTPEYAAWHAANTQAQQGDTSSAEQAGTNLATGADAVDAGVTAAGFAARNNFSAGTAGLGTSVLTPGTTRAPTVAESLAKYGPQAGASSAGFNTGLTTGRVATAPRPVAGTAYTATIDQGGGTTQGPTKVGTAADQATDAIGPAPQVDQGLADRRLGEYQEALGMSREVIDRLLNGPNTVDRIGSQVLRGQLALARSAAGGPGAVAAAHRNAQSQAPELQAAAQQQAAAEELQRVTAAGNVAGNFAQAALGARGQDVDIAKKNTDAGIAVKGMITDLTGTILEIDQRNQELLGQMARDMAAMDFDWAQLTAQQQNAALDRYLTQYGIDANIRSQINLAAQSGKMGLKDWINAGVSTAGAAASVAAAASDVRVKTEIERATAEDLAELFETFAPATFEYIDPERFGEGRFLGGMAQDLQRSKLGASMVQASPEGVLMVDGGRAGMAALAGVALIFKLLRERGEI